MIIDFFKNNLLGILEDNILGITLGEVGVENLYKFAYPFQVTFDPLSTSEPIMWSIFYFFALKFNPILVYNLLVLVTLALVLISGFYFYRHFLNNKYVAALMSVIFTFSPYFYYRSQSHISLLQVWLVLLFLFFFFKATRLRHYLFLGVLLSIITLVSNYLGFFTLLFLGAYLIGRQISLAFVNEDYWTKRTLLSFGLMFSTFAIIVFSAITPYIQANYFSVVSDVPSEGQNYELSRPIEDFFVFTSRPWYYFLPSVENPVFGNITQNVVTYLEQDWGNFLAHNYFRSEHSTSYLGIVNFIFALLGFYYVYKLYLADVKKRRQNPDSPYWHDGSVLIGLFITAIILFSFTLPPYVVIKGVYFYTPSYLLYEFFPMFRVLARLGIFILMLQLIFTGFGYLWFIKIVNLKTKQKIGKILVLGFFAISLTEFFIPIRVTTISQPPEVYSYVRTNTSEDSVLVVYPRGYEVEALFWMRTHKRAFTNVKNFQSKDFRSTTFTNNLNTCEGLQHAQELGVTHLVYFYNGDANSEENLATLSFVEGLSIVEEFSNNYYIRRYDGNLVNRQNLKDNAAILYKIDNVSCEL